MSKSRDIFIMCDNTEIMRINFDNFVFDIINNQLLPFTIKGRIKPLPKMSSPINTEEIHEFLKCVEGNKEVILSWIANRVLLLSRSNAKWLYNLIKVEQIDSKETRLKIALMCKAVSVADNYWIKLEGETINWDDVNIRENPLNEVIAQVALHGSSLTLQGSLVSPEFTTNGTFAKSWRRHTDGLWLYKASSSNGPESEIEVICSNLLDKMNVNHCLYKGGVDNGLSISMCPCMSNNDLSLLTAYDYAIYCEHNNINFMEGVLSIDADSFYKMCIVDYLIGNNDRHMQNWGFYYNSKSTNIISCHPLFDHNMAFKLYGPATREAPSKVLDMSVRDAAKLAVSKVKFEMISEVYEEDFPNAVCYKEFLWRLKDLGLQNKPGFLSGINMMISS